MYRASLQSHINLHIALWSNYSAYSIFFLTGLCCQGHFFFFFTVWIRVPAVLLSTVIFVHTNICAIRYKAAQDNTTQFKTWSLDHEHHRPYHLHTLSQKCIKNIRNGQKKLFHSHRNSNAKACSEEQAFRWVMIKFIRTKDVEARIKKISLMTTKEG